MRLYLVKAPGGYFIPASDVDRDEAEKLKNGVVYTFDAKKERNSLFHRKVLALIRLGFDAWDPVNIFATQYTENDRPDIPSEIVPEKDFERFREDLTIAAGHYYAVYKFDGSIELKAKSISFASIDEIEFEDLFSRYVDVLLKDVLSKYTRADIDNIVDQVLGFV